MKIFVSALLAISLFAGVANSQIVRISSKIGPAQLTGLSTGFFVDATTIIATDHSVSMDELVELHIVAQDEKGQIILKEFGKAKVVYEAERSTSGQTDDIAILKLQDKLEVKNPLTLSSISRCEGIICMAPGFPGGTPKVLSVIGHANTKTSLGDVYDFKVLSGSSLCVPGCSGSPIQSIEMGGHVAGMISRQTDNGYTAVCIPSYVIKKHLELYNNNINHEITIEK